MNKLELQKVANEVRKGIITGVHAAKAGHPGGSLSAADLFTYLYFEEMNVDPKNPQDPDRDPVSYTHLAEVPAVIVGGCVVNIFIKVSGVNMKSAVPTAMIPKAIMSARL